MKNDITINENFRYHDYDFLKPALEQSLDYLKIKDVAFSIIFVGKRYIKKLNKAYRGINKTTDVISFALQDEVDIESNLLGDIYICMPIMKKQAKKYKHSEKRELTFLALHGLLHLLGYDHMKEDDEKVMFGLQDKILDYLKIYR